MLLPTPVHLLDEVGKAGRLERLDVRSHHRPLKMKDQCVVRGRGETKPGVRTVGARTLPHSFTNPADTSPSNEQGPRLWGQLFIPSQLGEMERERRGVEASSNGTLLPHSAVIFLFFFCIAASIHTTKSKPNSSLDGWSATLKSIHEWPLTPVAVLQQQPELLLHLWLHNYCAERTLIVNTLAVSNLC